MERLPFFKRGELSLFADFLFIRYDDFSDVRVVTTPGQEPLYELDSTVIRAYLSVWY